MRLMTNRDSFRSVIVPLLAKAEHIKKVVVTLWEHVLKNVKKQSTDSCWSSSWRTEACGKDACWSSLWRTVSSGRDLPMLKWEERMKECQRQTDCISHPLALLRDEEVEETRVKPDLGSIWQDGQEGIFVFVFTVHHPTLLLIGNKLIFPQVCFACGFNWWVILSLSQPTRFVLFSPLSCWRREGRDTWLSSQD